jgi:hypothetical protein
MRVMESAIAAGGTSQSSHGKIAQKGLWAIVEGIRD